MKPLMPSRSVFVPSPHEGTCVMGGSYDTRPAGTDRMSVHLLRWSTGGRRGYRGDCLLYEIKVDE